MMNHLLCTTFLKLQNSAECSNMLCAYSYLTLPCGICME